MTLRGQILLALEYPRRIIQDAVDVDACAHAGHFRPKDPGCETCDSESECSWLFSHDAAADLGSRPVDALGDALEYCYAYIDARVTTRGHVTDRCRCDDCAWLRDSAPLVLRVQQGRQANP